MVPLDVKSKTPVGKIVTHRDEETGQFEEEYPDEMFLEAIDELDVATTSEVAEYVGCSYDLAYRRLHTLANEGAVTKIEAGNSFIWDLD